MRFGLILGLCVLGLSAQTHAGQQCDQPHRIVIADMQVNHPPNDLLHLGKAFSERVADELKTHGFRVVGRLPATQDQSLEPAKGVWLRQSAPYFLNLRGSDFQVQGKRSRFEILPVSYEKRSGRIYYTLDQGAEAMRLREGGHSIKPANDTPRQTPVDTTETRFWENEYGEHMQLVARDIADAVAAEITCRPVLGRVTETRSRHDAQELYIDLGQVDGITEHTMFRIIRNNAPLASLGSHALTRREQAASQRPEYAPESMGSARVVHLSSNYAILRYDGPHAISTGMQVQQVQ